MNMNENAGIRLIRCQKHQGTNFCLGLDPHYEGESGALSGDYYRMYQSGQAFVQIRKVLSIMVETGRSSPVDIDEASSFLAGVVGHCDLLINTAWGEGIRVFKPQASFYELFQQFGPIIIRLVCRIIQLRASNDDPAFIILDAKRGDIATTQLPYYQAYLSSNEDEVFPGMKGQFNFDAMTVTTWMG